MGNGDVKMGFDSGGVKDVLIDCRVGDFDLRLGEVGSGGGKGGPTNFGDGGFDARRDDFGGFGKTGVTKFGGGDFGG